MGNNFWHVIYKKFNREGRNVKGKKRRGKKKQIGEMRYMQLYIYIGSCIIALLLVKKF